MLTDRQKDFLIEIGNNELSKDDPLSFRELAGRMNLCISSTSNMIRRLRDRGMLVETNEKRSLRLTDDGWSEYKKAKEDRGIL